MNIYMNFELLAILRVISMPGIACKVYTYVMHVQSTYICKICKVCPVLGEPGTSGELCPYYLEAGTCSEGDLCINIHGLLCEHCNRYCLPPDNSKLQKVRILAAIYIMLLLHDQ